MSLINQMLKDLEARNRDQRMNADLPMSVYVVDEPAPHVRPGLLIFGIAVAAVLGAAWFILGPSRGPGPAGDMPVVGTVALAPPTPQPPQPAPSAALSLPTVPEMPAPSSLRSATATSTGEGSDSVPVAEQSAEPAAEVKEEILRESSASAPRNSPPGSVSRGTVSSHRFPAPSRKGRLRAEGAFEVSAESLYDRGARAYADGRAVSAREDLERALRLQPAHRRARLLLARCDAALGDDEGALALLDEHDDLRGDVDAETLRAQLLLKMGRSRQAEQVLESLAANAGGDPDVQGLLGTLRQRQGRYGEAATHYRHALEAQPTQPRWWLGLAISLEAGERFQEALEAYGRTAALGGLSRDVEVYVVQRIEALRGQR